MAIGDSVRPDFDDCAIVKSSTTDGTMRNDQIVAPQEDPQWSSETAARHLRPNAA